MTVKQFYLRALTIPVVVPLAWGGVASLSIALNRQWPPPMDALLGIGAFVGVVGVLSAIPYGLFVAGVLLWLRRPRSARAMRRVPWLAPAMIAIPFAIALTLPDLVHGAWHHAAGTITFYGGFALLVGYVYAAAIQLVFAIFQWTGRIQEAG